MAAPRILCVRGCAPPARGPAGAPPGPERRRFPWLSEGGWTGSRARRGRAPEHVRGAGARRAQACRGRPGESAPPDPGAPRRSTAMLWPRSPLSRRPLGRQQLGLMLRHQCVDDLAQRLALDDLGQLVQGQVDAVIADSRLRKIVGTNSLGAVSGTDLAAALGSALGFALLPLEIVEPGAQDRHGLGAVAVLRPIFLHHHDY